MENKIIVLDFGSQYNQLIVRRIRELGVYSELCSHKISAQEIKKQKNIVGIVLSGGPNSVYEKNAMKIDKTIFSLNIPILGICYGMQLISHIFDGKVQKINHREYGFASLNLKNKNQLTDNIPKSSQVWMSHTDQVVKLPKDFICLGSTKTCNNAIIANNKKRIFGVQFHPEVSHTKYGMKLISNFTFKICNAKKQWTVSKYIDNQIKKIKETVGKDKVICALSGGVDSMVAATLVHKAIGNQLTCVFVDHGLLRKEEAQNVIKQVRNKLKINLVPINASKTFLTALKNISDPEQKRKIIGKLFIQEFEKHAKKIKNIKWLVQGTLYTDLIESGTNSAKTIKSHHNVGGLPKKMSFKLIEPLNSLFKDEVRKLGLELGLSKDIVYRQPFPGPGLAIRIIGDITSEKIKLVQESDAILREEIKKAKLDNQIWQYFTVLTNQKSVGVKGDNRSYEYVLVIRAVTSVDGMTADYAKIPYNVLDIISYRITNEVDGINRVVYDITSKPPATIEWE